MSKKPILLGLSAMIAASFALPASAQESPAVFEEIVVTASKRAQTLQEVPIAVTVVSAEVIDKARIEDITDLQFIVPSLRVTQLQTTGNTNFIIRGFGNGANNAGIEPSVGVFIDGVYRSRSASALGDLPNLERIEVLRGPQSTLFGKNASAGVISIITAKPDLDGYSGSASLTVGDYSEVIVKGDITGPLSDTFAFSLSGSSAQRDGYYTNLSDGTKYNEHDRWGMRGQLLWQPTDNLEFRFIADHDEFDEVCCGVSNIQDGPTGNIIRAIGGQLLPEDPFARAQFYDFNPTNEVENDGVSLQFDYDFDTMTFTSITAYREQSRFENSDVDFTSARLINPNSNDVQLETFTQEFRLASSGQGAFDWMIGAYIFDEQVDVANVITYDSDFRPYADVLTTVLAGGIPGVDPSPLDGIEAAIPQIPAGTFFGAGQGNVEFAGADNQAFSLFANVDIPLGDRVTLTLGASYIEDEKDTFVNMVNTDVFSALDLVVVGGGLIFQGVYAQVFAGAKAQGATDEQADAAATIAAGQAAQAWAPLECGPDNPPPACNALLALQPLQFLPPFLDFPNSVESGSSKDDTTTWNIRLAVEVTDSVNMYVSAGTGFKATSWNLSRDSRPFESDLQAIEDAGLSVTNLTAGTRSAGPEDSTLYEIGLKARFARGALNIAIFDQEIEGFQSNVFLGSAFSLVSAGKQSTTGIEIDTTFLATDDWEITFAGTWLDPVYDSFSGAAGVGGEIVDLSGQAVPGVHEFSMNLSTTYNFQLGATTTGFIRAAYVYDSDVQIIENVPKSIASREVNIVNASLGFEWDNGFQAMLWGRNITNDDYLMSAFPSVAQAGSYSGYPNEPRTYGVTFTMNFN